MDGPGIAMSTATKSAKRKGTNCAMWHAQQQQHRYALSSSCSSLTQAALPLTLTMTMRSVNKFYAGAICIGINIFVAFAFVPLPMLLLLLELFSCLGIMLIYGICNIKMQLLIAHCATKTIRDRKMAAIILLQLSCKQLVRLPHSQIHVFKFNCAKHMAHKHTQTHTRKWLRHRCSLWSNIWRRFGLLTNCSPRKHFD